MNEEQRLLINAYSDGETDRLSTARARELIHADADAHAYWQSLQHTDELLRDAFAPIADAAVPARFDAVIDAARPRWRMRQFAPLAAAASLALVVVMLAREHSVTEQMDAQLAQMRGELAALKNHTLENKPSGSPGSWIAPVGFARAEVTPLQTYRTRDNRFCREYEERVEDASGVEIRRGIACRVGKGDWPDVADAPSLPADPAAAGRDVRL
ncbi:MAG: RT0821/Lpp0805 family surface protein [Gammaproteobacteria bacterium]|nr:RT0821/Lpp0805 family surface protein [Gammaproteobacteria bacterium]